jgi:hypothetical protein
MKKQKEEEKKANLILSHVNHTFFILDPWIWPQAFRHTHYTLGEMFFLIWTRMQLNIQFYPGPFVLEPCNEVALKISIVKNALHWFWKKKKSILYVFKTSIWEHSTRTLS